MIASSTDATDPGGLLAAFDAVFGRPARYVPPAREDLDVDPPLDEWPDPDAADYAADRYFERRA